MHDGPYLKEQSHEERWKKSAFERLKSIYFSSGFHPSYYAAKENRNNYKSR